MAGMASRLFWDAIPKFLGLFGMAFSGWRPPNGGSHPTLEKREAILKTLDKM